MRPKNLASAVDLSSLSILAHGAHAAMMLMHVPLMGKYVQHAAHRGEVAWKFVFDIADVLEHLNLVLIAEWRPSRANFKQ